MTQIAIPDGFDLIYFSWDRQATFPIGAGVYPNVGLAPSSVVFPAAVPHLNERAPIEEDVERWDGLS